MQANDTDRARDALNTIPPDLPRDQWVKAGMAFHAAGGGFDDFDQWSAQADTTTPKPAAPLFAVSSLRPVVLGLCTVWDGP
ncbi:MAG: PriCT-2 domain-containing protein [Rhodoferax sp.]|nr:PriCT-2 domain-containing protein [Rhodoferax sp.]